MTIEELKLLTDINIAIDSIKEHLQNKYDFSFYKQNKTVRRATERELEIIGEAVNKLDKINPNINISYKRMIVDLRNKVIHAYDNVNDVIIWKVITKDLPILKKEIEEFLKDS
jgi:uncharacterized protein with HEPN domain